MAPVSTSRIYWKTHKESFQSEHTTDTFQVNYSLETTKSRFTENKYFNEN